MRLFLPRVLSQKRPKFMSKILICTGIYPPAIGGPAQYAKEIEGEFRGQGHVVKVLTYTLEHHLPPLVRHELFFWKTFLAILNMRMSGKNSDDFILTLDTFSVGWPAVVAAKILGKKILIRTGGDFLWESYVERTGDLVLLKNFYDTRQVKLNLKERTIFAVTKWTLQNVSAVIFSTEWQRDIFTRAYNLDPGKNFVVENFYGEKIPTEFASAGQSESRGGKKVFVAGTRPLKWKNIERLKLAFDLARKNDWMIDLGIDIDLDLSLVSHKKFIEKVSSSHAVILVSLGDISPNMIMDALKTNTPFIVTKETGLLDRLKEVGIFVDPENTEDIKQKILFLADKNNYEVQKKKIESFNFTHSWEEICQEILAIAHKTI